MSDMIDILMGIDKRKEIFDLWYEVTFLRMVLIQVIEPNPELGSKLDIEKCRRDAQEVVKNRFPNAKIDFPPPEEPTPAKQQEHSCCTHPDSKECDPASPSPSSEE